MFHVPQNFNDGIMLFRGRKNSKRVIFDGGIHIGNNSVLVNHINIISTYIAISYSMKCCIQFNKMYENILSICIYCLNIIFITENRKMREHHMIIFSSHKTVDCVIL